MAHLIDNFLMLFALAAPACLVLRFNLAGAVVGALTLWLTLVFAGEVLSALDPGRSRLTDAVWVQAGWLASLIYCLLIYGAKQLYSFLRGRRRRAI